MKRLITVIVLSIAFLFASNYNADAQGRRYQYKRYNNYHDRYRPYKQYRGHARSYYPRRPYYVGRHYYAPRYRRYYAPSPRVALRPNIPVPRPVPVPIPVPVPHR